MTAASENAQTTSNTGPKHLEVFSIRSDEGKSLWTRCGVAFVNRDGSINVVLDHFPTEGKLQLRAPRPREGARRE